MTVTDLSNITEVKFGETGIQDVYLGNTHLWPFDSEYGNYITFYIDVPEDAKWPDTLWRAWQDGTNPYYYGTVDGVRYNIVNPNVELTPGPHVCRLRFNRSLINFRDTNPNNYGNYYDSRYPNANGIRDSIMPPWTKEIDFSHLIDNDDILSFGRFCHLGYYIKDTFSVNKDLTYSGVTETRDMFNTFMFKNIDLTNLHLPNITNAFNMFGWARLTTWPAHGNVDILETINLGDNTFSLNTDFRYMFYSANIKKIIGLENIDTTCATSLYHFCSATLEDGVYDFRNYNTRNCKDFRGFLNWGTHSPEGYILNIDVKIYFGKDFYISDDALMEETPPKGNTIYFLSQSHCTIYYDKYADNTSLFNAIESIPYRGYTLEPWN